MIFMARNLPRDIRSWDRVSRLAFIIGFALLVMAVVVFFFGPDSIRMSVLFGMVGLMVVLELTILYGNRGMRSVFSQAQAYYTAGEFETVQQVLETAHHQGRSSFRTLTLLGNTYRQLGDLDASERVLSEAVNKAPTHHFSLYGFGRTLLAKGQFGQAAVLIKRAVDAGAPPVVLADLGEAYFLNDEKPEAHRALLSASALEGVQTVPHRALMTAYLLHQLESGPPPSAALAAEGLPYWRASVERYGHTAYGQWLHRPVEEFEQLQGN